MKETVGLMHCAFTLSQVTGSTGDKLHLHRIIWFVCNFIFALKHFCCKQIIPGFEDPCSSLTCLMCLRERKTDNLLWATFQLLQSGIREVSGEHLDRSCPSTASGWEEGFSSSSEPSQPSDSSLRSSKKGQICYKYCCCLGKETASKVPTQTTVQER